MGQYEQRDGLVLRAFDTGINMEATELTDEQIKDTAAIVIALTQLEETLGSEGRPLLASHAAAARYSLRWMATRLMPPPSRRCCGLTIRL